eukprot:755672-Prorocentrum_minimum.AAC.3
MVCCFVYTKGCFVHVAHSSFPLRRQSRLYARNITCEFARHQGEHRVNALASPCPRASLNS